MKKKINKTCPRLKETEQSDSQKQISDASIDHLVDAVALDISQRQNSPGIFGFQKSTLNMLIVKSH